MLVRSYVVDVEEIALEEGGGWFATVPDLPGCMSDGATLDELGANLADAIGCWTAAARRLGRSVPPPSRPDQRSPSRGARAA